MKEGAEVEMNQNAALSSAQNKRESLFFGHRLPGLGKEGFS